MTDGINRLNRIMGRTADAAIRLSEAITANFRTIAARGQAVLADDVRILADGRIINIQGDPASVCLGPHARIRGEIVTYAHAGQITIGSWFYLGPGSMIWSSDDDGITIGDRVLVSANVMIHDTNSHPIDPQARFEQTQAIFTSGHPRTIIDIRSAPVRIGDDVWVGAGAKILKGVTIGARTIIGAGSVIATNVAADTLVPAGAILQDETVTKQ